MRFARKLLFPSLWVLLILLAISTVGLVAVFVNRLETALIAYFCYGFAFYTLCVLCAFCWKKLTGYWKCGREKLAANPRANRYFSDAAFRTHMNLYRSLAGNLLYAAINAGFAARYRTHWFAIFAVYYAILAAMRFLLIRYISKNEIGRNRLGELLRVRLCAYILLTVNLVLSGTVLMMVYFRRGFDDHGMFIYVMAMYTFYVTVTALIDLFKYRKYRSLLLSMTKMIKLAAALVSILPLEAAMFSQFGVDMPPAQQRIMIMATGAGIAVIIITIAIYMIVRTTKEIKERRSRNENETSSGE